MFGTGLIVFRETLEAALFVGIVAASTRGVPNRSRWLAIGVGAGAVCSVGLAAAMERIGAWAEGFGQDLVAVAIISLALVMLAWHSIWVSAHASEMSRDARRIGSAASSGPGTSLWALAIAVAMSVLREGAETVLFVSGLASGSHERGGALVVGVLLGAAAGALVGCLVYSGLGRVRPQRLFGVTHLLILLLAGGLASQLAKTLNQADLLTVFGDKAWDLSPWLSNDSAIGMILHGVAGYDASPSRLQFLFYLGTIVLIGLSSRQMKALVHARSRADVATH